MNGKEIINISRWQLLESKKVYARIMMMKKTGSISSIVKNYNKKVHKQIIKTCKHFFYSIGI